MRGSSAQVNSRRSVFCSGPLDRRDQARVFSGGKTDTPMEATSADVTEAHITIVKATTRTARSVPV